MMKKLMTLLTAVLMVLTLAGKVNAEQSSANTITINNAKEGETYKAYKMLQLVVDNTTNPTAYAYTIASDWTAFFGDDNIAVWGTVLEKDATGTYFQRKEGVADETAWSATSDLSAFAEAAEAYAKANNLTPVASVTVASGATTAVLNTTVSGYYLVTSTLGTRAMIDTTPGNVTINEKNALDTIEKKVQEDSTNAWGTTNDVQIGDTVYFLTKVTVVPRSVNVVIHDKLDDAFTFGGKESVFYYTDEACTTPLDESLWSYKATPDTGDTFTIIISDDFAAETTADAYIYIKYSAVVNKNIISSTPAIVPQKNTTTVTFGDDQVSQESVTTTTTHKLAVHKYSTAKDPLADAIFQLEKDGNVVYLVKIDANNYRVADSTDTGTASTHVAANGEVATIASGLVSDFVTVASGNIVIWGVDSDKDYSIVELQAPKGYNLLNPTTKTVGKVSDTLVVDVENLSGAELPSTGGIGTTIFHVAGALLVLGAGIVLISKKRANNN